MTLNIGEELQQIASKLNEQGIEYALCGGLAVALHGFPRATQDIDILIKGEDLESVLHLLNAHGYTLSGGSIPFDIGQETESRIYRISKASGEELLTVDLVLVSPILEDVWAGRETYQVDDYSLKVVSLDGLRTMKRLAGRPQDLVDLERLDGSE